MRRLTLICLLSAACSPAPPLKPEPGGAGESCAMPFNLGSGTSISIGGTTKGFADDDGSTLSSCGGGGAPDVVFTFTAAISAIVDVTVFAEEASFQPIVKLRGAQNGCVAMDDACDSATARGKTAQVQSWSPTVAGVQSIVVDGQSMTSGMFTLEVKQR